MICFDLQVLNDFLEIHIDLRGLIQVCFLVDFPKLVKVADLVFEEDWKIYLKHLVELGVEKRKLSRRRLKIQRSEILWMLRYKRRYPI